ncbi:tetratricopeptide repeat protein [Streptomyces sp. RS10V-4]|uniref:tetratricopeptide repeat protein n=1 Tax=Streptomyces rhizoryzae TaxID=2932493 RepID=UPI002003263A|nr:tetratricopeptide repeat protein [Streptomyces rhizoryzae]MCK7627442.1 tetratricopeptide repeat protein [Streptomyces rhizoryzae]
MPGERAGLREGHRKEAEALLKRSVEEEERRAGGRLDGAALLARASAALDELAAPASEEYAAYVRALDEASAGRRPLAARLTRKELGTGAVAALAAAVAACGAGLAYGTGGGPALGAGGAALVAGAAAAVVKLAAGHFPAAHRQAGLRGRPGGPEQLRLAWLTALEVRGVRPFLDQQRMLAGTRSGGAPPAASAGKGSRGPQLRGADRSAAARRRSVLERSFAQLPEPGGPFAGRRAELGQIARWVQAGRASTGTQPTVVVLHGEPGSGRTALAVRAAHQLRDQFRGACVVDLRGDTPGEVPLPVRDALLHLLNRLGAPREQLLFRERPSQEQHVTRLTEIYHRHLAGLPVTVLLDDAADAEQVRALVPDGSDSLVLVTSRTPLRFPADLAARVHQLPVTGLDTAGAEELLRSAAAAGEPPARAAEAYDAPAAERIAELCGGLPLALRVAGSALGDRSPAALARELAAADGAAPVERALALRYADQPPQARQLLRRLALVGRASLGTAAAAALLGVADAEAGRQLTALAGAGLVEHVRGTRYRLHPLVHRFAHARLTAEEEPAERAAAQERLIRGYAELADAVIRLVDGNTSTRADRFGPHGFPSLDAALQWLDDETSFITAALRHADQDIDQAAVSHLLGALCDYCLLRGDLYRLGELSELTRAAGQGLLVRSVQWRTGVAARQLGELDRARTTLSSVVDLYFEAQHPVGAARALRDLGITLQQQGQLSEAAARLREALEVQSGPEMRGDRAWTLHALAAVERDRARLAEAEGMLRESLALHEESESLHGQAWAHFQLGQVHLRRGEVAAAESALHAALELYGRTRDDRGTAWAMTQLARARLVAGDAGPAVDGLQQALPLHRQHEDARGEAWTMYYLGQALEERGERDAALRQLERSRNMFSRMQDGYGLACARHHAGRVTRDLRAEQTGSLRNSGFARQLLQDARKDFQRIGVAHGEAWSLLELVVIDAGNGRFAQALELAGEAAALFAGYGDRRGEDWARFLRCTLLPFASPGGSVVGTAVAQEELAQLVAERHGGRDAKLTEYAQTLGLLLERGVEPETGWQAWRLGMVPDRQAREVMGVPAAPAAAE